ncbi:MAG: methionine--tRNA ligase [Nanobdellota archaeon]
MAKRTVITAALPYANGSIHIGHLVEYIQSDIFTRVMKLLGEKAIFCCADDTHGTPIEIKAHQQGITPEELIEKYHKEHFQDFRTFSIYFDSYYSTNSEENKKYSDLIFNRLNERGLIYTKDVENFFDEELQRFLPDRFVKGKCPKCGAEDQYGDVCEKCNSTYTPVDLLEPFSVLTGKKPVRKKSKHYFFKLKSLAGKLDEWLKNNENLQPEIKNYVRNWIKEGLEDWDISRDGPYFGFKIPGEENKYYYVWLDAPIGYISSTEKYCKDNGENVEDYWNNSEGRIIHFIGKDIIYFHLLFWPAMLMEAGFNLPDDIVVHGFLTINKEKMSKSRGTFLTAKQFAEKADPEFLRFYYAANLTRRLEDLDLDLEDFRNRINNELVGNVANFIYRVFSFTNRFFDSKVVDVEMPAEAKELTDKAVDYYRKYEFRQAINTMLELSAFGNRYMQENEPWKKVKEDREEAHRVLSVCVNIAKNVIALLKPVMPYKTDKFEEQLGMETDLKNPGSIGEHSINKAKIILKRIEKLEFEDPLSAINLKTARIMSVEKHPEADKLYMLRISLGSEERQLVAGLRYHYREEELKGKNIVIVSNLKPAKLKGRKSEGMLLAASKDDKVKVIDPGEVEPGTQVKFGDVEPKEKKLDIKEFFRHKITVSEKRIRSSGRTLKINGKELNVDMPDGSKIS